MLSCTIINRHSQMNDSGPMGPLGFFFFFFFVVSNHIFKNFFQEYHRSVKQYGSRSGPTFCEA